MQSVFSRTGASAAVIEMFTASEEISTQPILNGYLPQTALFIKAAPTSVSFYHMETHKNTQVAAVKGSQFIYHLI